MPGGTCLPVCRTDRSEVSNQVHFLQAKAAAACITNSMASIDSPKKAAAYARKARASSGEVASAAAAPMRRTFSPGGIWLPSGSGALKSASRKSKMAGDSADTCSG